jgi:STIP1 family protein 1
MSSNTNSSSCSSSNKLKEEGNKLFMKRNYKEAIEMYSKAIEKANISTYYINRALCYFKMQQWSKTVEDCRKAIELDAHSVKAHFYMGQALCEMNHHDEAIVNLTRAHELTKELNENYGDEITRTVRNAKRRRWNFLEEKRIKQEIELQKYLTKLMLDDKQKQIDKIKLTEPNEPESKFIS